MLRLPTRPSSIWSQHNLVPESWHLVCGVVRRAVGDGLKRSLPRGSIKFTYTVRHSSVQSSLLVARGAPVTRSHIKTKERVGSPTHGAITQGAARPQTRSMGYECTRGGGIYDTWPAASTGGLSPGAGALTHVRRSHSQRQHIVESVNVPSLSHL